MHLLLVHQYYLGENDSGGSRWTEFVKNWIKQGHQVTVLAGMVHYATGNKIEKYKGLYTSIEEINPNLTIIRSHVSELYNVNFLGRLWGYFSFVFSSIYAGLFKARKKYDIIISTSPPLFIGITSLVLSKIKRVPYVFEIRDLWPESAIDIGVLKNQFLIKLSYFLEKLIYNNAVKISVLTPAFRDKLIELKGISASKIILVPNAADFSLTETLIDKFDVNAFKAKEGIEDKFIILYVGAHGVANHLIQVLDVAEKFRNEPEILFLLIGDGMKKKELVIEAEKRNLFNIKFIDAVPKNEIFKYILSCDIGSSILKKADAFKTVYSNKTFDYMSCKKPILMLIDGVSRKLVEEANCGLYIEPENITEFEEGIRYYLKNKSVLKEHGNNGYNYAKKNFDRDFISQYYLEQLKKVV
jgi:glycosyltransferase involved in cell wall biosynthesis